MALRVVLLAVSFVAATGFAPASFRSGKYGVAPLCQQQTNFVDADVDCKSEGGKFTSPPITKASVQDVSSFKVGQTNFVDEDVVCNSEGGKWSSEVMSQAPPSFSKPPARTSAVNNGEEEWASTFSLVVELFGIPATALSIVQLCDRIDNTKPKTREISLLKIRRQMLLTKMLQDDREKYLETVKFLGARIPRDELPNLQDVPYFNYQGYSGMESNGISMSGELISDCALPNITYSESPLDKVLLYIFRDLVRKEIQWRSNTPGIKGLLEEGRHYMLSPAGAIAENQHAFVRRTLGALLTPVLPPFYRIFMAGIVPSQERGDPEWLANGAKYVIDQINNIPAIADTTWAKKNLVPGNQIGPWFYAPLLTSVVTPPFLTFLVGRIFSTVLLLLLSSSSLFFLFLACTNTLETD